MDVAYLTLDLHGIDTQFKVDYIYYPEELSYPDAPDLPEDIELCGLYVVTDEGGIFPVDNLLCDPELSATISDIILEQRREELEDV